MNINNINNFTSFGKVIRTQDANQFASYRYNDWEKTEKNIAKILNNEECDEYTSEEKDKIKKFFATFLGEDNTPVIHRTYHSDKFFLTGQDAQDVLDLEKYSNDINKITIPNTNFENPNPVAYDEEYAQKVFKEAQRYARVYAQEKGWELAKKTYESDPKQVLMLIDNKKVPKAGTDTYDSFKLNSILASANNEDYNYTKKLQLNA